MGFEARSLGFEPQVHHLLVVRPWTLCALFSHRKTELITTVPSVQGRRPVTTCVAGSRSLPLTWTVFSIKRG